MRNRRGPATVSGEPSPCLYGSHWETSREGWATALSHESGDLVATWKQTPFREKRSGRANREQGPGPDVALGGAAGGRPGDEAGGKGRDEGRGPGGGDGDHGAHAGHAARGGPQRDHGERLQDLSLRDGGRGHAERAGSGHPPLRLARQDVEHLDSRGQFQPGAGAGGRSPCEEPDPGPGRSFRPLAGSHRADRDHPGVAVHPLRGRRHGRCGQHHHQEGPGARPGLRAAGGGQLRHAPVPRPGERSLEDLRLLLLRLAPREQRTVPERRLQYHCPQRPVRSLVALRLLSRLHHSLQ